MFEMVLQMYHPEHQDLLEEDRRASQETLSRKLLNAFRIRKFEDSALS
jgi:hypothetical protein